MTRNVSSPRFTQRDPTEYGDSMNLYQYVKANPVDRIDPYGLWGEGMHRETTAMLAGQAGMCFPKEVGDSAYAPDEDKRSPPRSYFAYLGWLIESMVFGIDIDKFEAIEERLDTAADWHFPRDITSLDVKGGSDAARRELEDGIKSCNLKQFSEGLHVLQDSYSHEGPPPLAGDRLGHSRDRFGQRGVLSGLSTDAEDPRIFWEDAREACVETFEAIKKFLKECPCVKEGPHKGKNTRCGRADIANARGFCDSRYPPPAK
ncbi:MAG: RHS repeat-associated core domain-containing protein [Phycisphaerae bacterium]